jgi:type II secretory pathway pseudopilin PulG
LTVGHDAPFTKTAVDYSEPPAPILESLAIHQNQDSASRVETRASRRRQEEQAEQDFINAIKTAFDSERQAHMHEDVQAIERYLQQLLTPQFETTLTNEEKETLVQQVLHYLRSHNDVPPTLLTKIKSHYVVTDTIPTPPKLTVLNINEITSPPPEGDTTAHITTPETSPGVASLKSDHFPKVPEYDLQVCELDTISESTPDPAPSNSPKLKPTTNTPLDRPNMKPFDVPSPCEQSQKHITEQQAHLCYLVF